MTNANPFQEFIDRYHDDPVLLVQEVLGGDPDEKQQAVMRDVAAGHRKIAVRSGHGVGKSTLIAWLLVWFALTRFPQKCLCTAPTSSQLFDALAAETKAWFKRLPAVFSDPDTGLFEIKTDRIELRAAPDESFITFATSRAETPEALAGKHSANMLIIADEASGVPEQVYEAAAGSMAGPNRTTILTGNPVRTQGMFFDVFNKPELAFEWRRHHISCEDHPRIPQTYCDEMAARYGKESNAYRVRVMGEFPLGDDDTVIPFHLLESAKGRDVAPLVVKPIWGLDVARFGSDKSALAVRKGNVLVSIEEWAGLDTMQTVGRIKARWDSTMPSERPSEIIVDVIGLGAGVVDRLFEMGLPVRGLNVSEAPAIAGKYLNQRAELWFKGREWFEKRACRVDDDDLLKELSWVRFKFSSSGKVQIESKDDLKKRGKPSPNRADAFLMTLASDAVAAAGTTQNATWQQPLRRNLKGMI